MATEAQCESCGETNAPGSSFCLFCGAYLGWDQPGAGPSGSEKAAPPPGPAAPPVTPAPPPTPPASSTPPPAPAAATVPLRPAPPSSTAPGPTRATTPAVPPSGGCPSCGHVNDPGRRFCARCGQVLVAAAPPARPASAAPRQGSRWWPWASSEERSAKREYRRSLPPLYRWRRVLVTLLVLALGVAVVAVVEGNPVEWAKDRYYDIRDEKDPVQVANVFMEPGNESTTDVTDRDPSTYWGMTWRKGAADVEQCADAKYRLRLKLEDAVRVLGLRVSPGLREGADTRLQRPRPETFLIWWVGEDGKLVCEKGEVDDEPTTRDLEFDTGGEVDRLWISVGSVFPAPNITEERPVGIRELEVLARP